MAHLSDIEEEEEEELEFGNDSHSSRDITSSGVGSERDNTLGTTLNFFCAMLFLLSGHR